MSDLENELERRTVTYTSWNQTATTMEAKGWHPTTFNYANAGPKQIKRIKASSILHHLPSTFNAPDILRITVDIKHVV